MKRLVQWILHPITMIVVVNAAWTVALVFWILFFIRRYRQVAHLAKKTGLSVQDLISWAPLVVGIVILVLIFAGTVALILALARQAIINKQMRNFLSFVSHELRTPLTSISLYLETMRDQDLPTEKRNEFIDKMLLDTNRLTRQIGGILDASRLERQKMPLRKELLDLERFVADYVAQKAPVVATGGHELTFETASNCTVLGDRDALRTALDNLVRNAERYSDQGKKININLTESGKWAVLSVEDQGIGIEPKERKKIFELFYRTASGQRASGRGSGLGLYIVKGIAGLHRGKVTLESEGPGKGARFSIWLPQVGDK